MAVEITLRGQAREVRAGMTIRHALLQLDIIPDSVLPTRDGELLTDDEILRDGDRIKLVPVISGGSG